MATKLYYDLMSQPSRSLYIIFKAAKIPHEAVKIDIATRQNLEPEYAKINRFQKLPAIDHKGFLLSESTAIVNYLSEEKLIPESLFPISREARARVNEFLAWHHIGLRAPCSLFFIGVVIEPMLTGQPTSPIKIEKVKKKMIESLDLVENSWLGAGNKYLVGNKITVADIFGCCEIEQTKMAGYDPKQGRPRIDAWMERVKTDLHPYYEEAHIILNKIAKKRQAKL